MASGEYLSAGRSGGSPSTMAYKDVSFRMMIIGWKLAYAQLAEDVVISFGRVRVSSQSAFDDGQTQRPDVGLHAVRAS